MCGWNDRRPEADRCFIPPNTPTSCFRGMCNTSEIPRGRWPEIKCLQDTTVDVCSYNHVRFRSFFLACHNHQCSCKLLFIRFDLLWTTSDTTSQLLRYSRVAWVAHSRCDPTFDGCLTRCISAAGAEPTSSLAAAWTAPRRSFPFSHRRRRSAASINSHQRRSASERLPQLMSLQLMSLISWQTPCESGGMPGARQSVNTCTYSHVRIRTQTKIAIFA